MIGSQLNPGVPTFDQALHREAYRHCTTLKHMRLRETLLTHTATAVLVLLKFTRKCADIIVVPLGAAEGSWLTLVNATG